MEQEQASLLMGFKRVKMRTTRQVCQMHTRKTMRSHLLKECKTQTRTLPKWMTRQSLISQTVICQMKRTTLKMNLKVNLLKSHFSRFILFQM
jgi:cell division FtsZ-interacting protein ZapD